MVESERISNSLLFQTVIIFTKVFMIVLKVPLFLLPAPLEFFPCDFCYFLRLLSSARPGHTEVHPAEDDVRERPRALFHGAVDNLSIDVPALGRDSLTHGGIHIDKFEHPFGPRAVELDEMADCFCVNLMVC